MHQREAYFIALQGRKERCIQRERARRVFARLGIGLDESHEHLSICLYYLADADTVESWRRFAMKVGEQFSEIGVIGLP